MATDNQNCYQSEPIPILYSKDEHESSKTQVTQIKQYSIHGGIQGTIKDNFPEVARELDDWFGYYSGIINEKTKWIYYKQDKSLWQ